MYNNFSFNLNLANNSKYHAPFLRKQSVAQSSTKPNLSKTSVTHANSRINEPISSVYFSSLAELFDWYNNPPPEYVLKLNIPVEDINKYCRSNSSLNNKKLKLLLINNSKYNYDERNDLKSIGNYSINKDIQDDRTVEFKYPQLIDYYIYFSKNLVSIPPVGWINYLHKNCIRCYASIYFDGSVLQDSLEIDRLLTYTNNEFIFIKVLLKLIKLFKFDGFFIKIDSAFTSIKNSTTFSKFVESLKSSLHSYSADTKLVWLDSFIFEKNLFLSNNSVINDLNYNMFNLTDLFLTHFNYSDSNREKRLKENIDNIGNLGKTNKLFINYNNEQDNDVNNLVDFCEMIFKRDYGNLALFSSSSSNERNSLFNLDLSFFKKLQKIVGKFNDPVWKETCSTFGFYTTFSTGKGVKFFTNGKIIGNDNWCDNNLIMSLPFNLIDNNSNETQNNKLFLNYIDSWFGGSCLELKIKKNENFKFELFNFNAKCEINILSVLVTFKILNNNLTKNFKKHLNLKIKYRIENKLNSSVIRIGYLNILIENKNLKNWISIREGFLININNKNNEIIILDSAWIVVENSEIDDKFNKVKEEIVEVDCNIEFENYEQIIEKIWSDVIEYEYEEWVVLNIINNKFNDSNRYTENNKGIDDNFLNIRIGELGIFNLEKYPWAKHDKKIEISNIKVYWNENIIDWYCDSDDRGFKYLVWVNEAFRGCVCNTVWCDDLTKEIEISICIDIVDNFGSFSKGESITIKRNS